MSFCSGSLTLFHNSDPHPISPNNNTALRLSLRAGGRGLIGPEEILAWLFPCLLEWMCTLFRLMAIITGKEFSIKYLLPRLIKWWCQWRCERKMLLKSDRNFDSALVNVIFEHVPCGFVITQRIVPQDLLCIFLSSSILKSCFLWQCHQCELGHHKESFVYVSTCRSEVRLSCCEVPWTQTQDNFVSDVSFHIIVTLAWFWLCKMWLFPWFVKYVIEIHVAKVALGVLHLNFLQIAPGQSTSFKLVDHSLTHNTSTQRVRSCILISLNAHWRIS